MKDSVKGRDGSFRATVGLGGGQRREGVEGVEVPEEACSNMTGLGCHVKELKLDHTGTENPTRYLRVGEW